MVFNSKTFLLFFSLFFVVYHLFARRFRVQNLLILGASLIFYGWWDWRFLGLLLTSAGIDYVAGILLEDATRPAYRKRVLAVSMAANLGILFVFKYFDFFATSFATALAQLGVHVHPVLLGIALPVGISFYTFQSMSYTIDIYRGDARAERNAITYFAFVSFFPHMVAGPIQRAHHLLRQLNVPRVLKPEHVREAVWLIAWGYFLKTVISDNAAPFADAAFKVDQTSGWSTVLGTIAFGIQIYCDFNAYSLIARGTGRLLGIEFIWNFHLPYLSTSIQEFWRRWHISLSTWLRDYLYIPLGGNRLGTLRTYVNLILTMFLGGLWHGAAWNFVLWGLLHGVALAIERYYRAVRGNRWRELPDFVGWCGTMGVVFVGWFLFRSRSWAMVSGMTHSLTQLHWESGHTQTLTSLLALSAPVAAVELWQEWKDDLLAALALGPVRFAALTGTLLALVIAMFDRVIYEFIYFQF